MRPRREHHQLVEIHICGGGQQQRAAHVVDCEAGTQRHPRPRQLYIESIDDAAAAGHADEAGHAQHVFLFGLQMHGPKELAVERICPLQRSGRRTNAMPSAASIGVTGPSTVEIPDIMGVVLTSLPSVDVVGEVGAVVAGGGCAPDPPGERCRVCSE